MKNKLLILLIPAIIFSCKSEKKSDIIEDTNYQEEALDVTTSIYPENISKVFEAHGGLDAWNKMQALKFTMPKESGAEITTTDLKNRYSLIEMPEHTIGYDGSNVWLQNNSDAAYKGKPKFYYNLMFYFYAMPFVLADDGIIYEDIEPLEFEGKAYPGIKIAYESGVGESPDDEYIIYYEADTHQMVWLGYTVTYFTQEKSKEFHFIKYSNWQEVNGLILPETLTWYGYENNKPTEKQRDLKFTDIQLTGEKIDATLFEKPDAAEFVE
ncbi:MAG: DUF6503 family protein [Bacteroidota bacterium]